MRYWLLAAVATFAAFAIFAAAGSLLSRAALRLLERDAEQRAAESRARLLFRLRILPGLLAVTAAFGVALPIFLWFEDADTVEPVSLTLGLLAAGGAFLLGRGLWRAVSACRSTARVVREWQRRGRPIAPDGAELPGFAFDDTFPTVAVAGILRPRLFIAERLLRECPPGQVAAMVSHECAHVSARDNVKRLLIRACPDVFGAPVRLERAWRAAAEEAADAAAASRHPSIRLDLAQALIHVARLAASRAPELASAFYLGGSIDARVRRLVDPASPRPPRRRGYVMPASLGLLAVAIVLAAPSLHAMMELAVRLLP